MLNTADVAPIPSASVIVAIKLNPGCFNSIRTARRKSCRMPVSSPGAATPLPLTPVTGLLKIAEAAATEKRRSV